LPIRSFLGSTYGWSVFIVSLWRQRDFAIPNGIPLRVHRERAEEREGMIIQFIPFSKENSLVYSREKLYTRSRNINPPLD
jgi:hypothetical protein